MNDVPALGAKGFTLTDEPEYEPVKVAPDRHNNIVMENMYIRATFNKSGHLIALEDKELE